MTSFTLNESPREAALREAARELKLYASCAANVMAEVGADKQYQITFAGLTDAIAKMEEVL